MSDYSGKHVWIGCYPKWWVQRTGLWSPLSPLQPRASRHLLLGRHEIVTAFRGELCRPYNFTLLRVHVKMELRFRVVSPRARGMHVPGPTFPAWQLTSFHPPNYPRIKSSFPSYKESFYAAASGNNALWTYGRWRIFLDQMMIFWKICEYFSLKIVDVFYYKFNMVILNWLGNLVVIFYKNIYFIWGRGTVWQRPNAVTVSFLCTTAYNVTCLRPMRFYRDSQNATDIGGELGPSTNGRVLGRGEGKNVLLWVI